MGWPPSVVIVVRHGARLDAADKQWHLTSPTPYDPPLTYGGWTQSRALGARIANILRSREIDGITNSTNGAVQNGGSVKKRKHKVVIHTSPFLRCVQTSLAISAGLAQSPGQTDVNRNPSGIKHSRDHFAPNLRSQTSTSSPKLALNTDVATQTKPIKKSILRVDACLGEWLTPDYYELITPPPGSTMMVAGAKADLLRREDYSNLIFSQNGYASKSHNLGFPGGWQSPTIAAAEQSEEDGPLSELSSLSQVLPKRDRGVSLGAASINGGRHDQDLPTSEHGSYQPPISSYAISHSDPIPPGYVAHARDACMNVDYQWDSMREPRLWGAGGEYGEEWSSMHKRFRKGLQSMLSWYANTDDAGSLVMKKKPSTDGESTSEEDTDLVLIVVSHGAGCNALIGALTNQPVLLDVGMASLTMAVRKPEAPPTPETTLTTPITSANSFISEQYEMAILASTEHLRSSTNSTPVSSRRPSAASISAFRERHYGNEPSPRSMSSLSGISTSPPSHTNNHHSMNASLGSIRRTSSVVSQGPKAYVLLPSSIRQTSMGLWGSISSTRKTEKDRDKEEVESSDADSLMMNFGNDGISDSNGAQAEPKENTEEAEKEKVLEMDEEEKGELGDENDDLAPLGGGGLWASPFSPGSERVRGWDEEEMDCQ